MPAKQAEHEWIETVVERGNQPILERARVEALSEVDVASGLKPSSRPRPQKFRWWCDFCSRAHRVQRPWKSEGKPRAYCLSLGFNVYSPEALREWFPQPPTVVVFNG